MSQQGRQLVKQTPSEGPRDLVQSGWKDVPDIRQQEHPRRGLGHSGLYHEAAVAFLKDFPIGSVLKSAAFDAWAGRRGYLEVPPTGTPKRSDAWQAHCQRRHHLKYNMIKASTHSRMRLEQGGAAFSIELGTGGEWSVVAPQDAMMRDHFGQAMHRLFRRKGRKYAHLLQSADWGEIAKKPALQSLIEGYYRGLRSSERRIKNEVQILLEESSYIETQVRHALEAGEITPQNGGIRGMLTEDNDTEVDEEDISGADVD